MSLLVRINLALTAVFLTTALLAAHVCWNILEANARRQVLEQAGLMMDSALATRDYTANEILPLLAERTRQDFPPQSVPFYAATQNFYRLRQHRADYTYKEATLNPTNPRDRAADWEADIILRFRNDPTVQEVVGDRDTPMGRALYLARPIRTEAQCAACHSTPAVAPQSLLARYGSNNGFGWQDREVVGAQIVSVPFQSATSNAMRAFRGFITSLSFIIAAVFIVVNLLLYTLIVRPVRLIAALAERCSLGDTAAGQFPGGGATEIASLTRSFDRMRKSLEKALRMLDS